jgi:nitrate reductase NapAB chaperone NapD
MPVCSYLVMPDPGMADELEQRLAAIPGCDVASAENTPLLVLVTDTAGLEEERLLQERLEQVTGIRALVLTFGEVDPDTPVADPLAAARGGGRRLPVVDPELARPILENCGHAAAQDTDD